MYSCVDCNTFHVQPLGKVTPFAEKFRQKQQAHLKQQQQGQQGQAGQADESRQGENGEECEGEEEEGKQQQQQKQDGKKKNKKKNGEDSDEEEEEDEEMDEGGEGKAGEGDSKVAAALAKLRQLGGLKPKGHANMMFHYTPSTGPPVAPHCAQCGGVRILSVDRFFFVPAPSAALNPAYTRTRSRLRAYPHTLHTN